MERIIGRAPPHRHDDAASRRCPIGLSIPGGHGAASHSMNALHVIAADIAGKAARKQLFEPRPEPRPRPVRRGIAHVLRAAAQRLDARAPRPEWTA
jgi:hypothetical protein